MIQRGKKILLFPIETSVRELDSRLALAMLCARPDWQIILGEHEELFKLSLRLRNAVGLLKNVTGGKRPWKYKRYKELNMRVIFLDEEGGIYESGPDHWRGVLDTRIDVNELVADDRVCNWGSFQAGHYRSKNPACAEHIVVTGHPRFDLCSPKFKKVYQEEADALRREHGKFILLNTNIIANDSSGPDAFLRAYNVSPEDVEQRTFYIGQVCHELKRLGNFIELVNHLSNEFPGHRVILRPHPSEDMRIYQTMFRHIPRVLVAREGSLNAWIQACQVLIHDGCTTALEGHLSGTPVINYHPVHDEGYDLILPNLVGLQCSTMEEVTTAIRDLDSGKPFPGAPPENIRRVTELFQNFDPSSDSFAAVAGVIGECQDEAVPASVVGTRPMMLWHRLTDPIRMLARPFPTLNRLLSRKYRGSEKFPPLDRARILRSQAIFEEITGRKVKLHFHTSKFFSVTTE